MQFAEHIIAKLLIPSSHSPKFPEIKISERWRKKDESFSAFAVFFILSFSENGEKTAMKIIEPTTPDNQ